jgi:hypothetical protein
MYKRRSLPQQVLPHQITFTLPHSNNLAMLLSTTAILTALGAARLAAAGVGDGVNSFNIAQSATFNIDNSFQFGIGAGTGLPRCTYEALGQVRSDEELLTTGQWDCNLPAPGYFQIAGYENVCDAGRSIVDIYSTGNDVYDVYCSGGDGSIIGQCYYRCSSTPCTTPGSGGLNIKLLDCYYDFCGCVQ